MNSKAGNESNAQARHLRPAERATYETLGNRWAVIVGISDHKHGIRNLEYAHRDAQELSKLLQTPSGGGFEKERIKELINEEATTANVARALRGFLKRPAREDLVLIYFACHGSPDPDRPANLYLITYDTDPADIAGTALPMREVHLALTETLLTERVVIIADTCHSGAISGGRRSVGNDAQVINAFLREAGEAKGGVALLTSAEASEVSREGKEWGGGHGVFTHFLLQGMRGDADGYGQPKDGKVTVRELFEYVRDNVKRETGDKQHPAVGNYSFDPNLPMAITGGVNAQTHYQLGGRLFELGRRLDDPERFRAAAEQFDEALQLTRITQEPFPAAELELGKALLAAGDHDAAVQSFAKLLERGAGAVAPEALFHLGVAEAERGNTEAARVALEEFCSAAPQHEHAAWVSDYLRRLADNTGGRRYALLIGINLYLLPMPLQGCVNDVRLMKTVLTKRCGFAESDVFTLLDATATRAGILQAFAEMAQRTTAADTVLVHYSGHSVPESRPLVFGAEPSAGLYLVVHDTIEENAQLRHGITHLELHQAMMAIPAENKTLVLDTHPSVPFNRLIERDGDYALLLASDAAEMTDERQVEIEGELLLAGLFTAMLTQYLDNADLRTLTYGQLINAVIAEIKAIEVSQTPLLIGGDREQLVFAREEIYLSLFEFARRRNYTPFTLEDLHRRYAHFRKHVQASFPAAHDSFGRAFLEKGDYQKALEALETVLDQRGSDEAETRLALGRAQIGAGLYQDALESFRRYGQLAPAEVAGAVPQLLEQAGKWDVGQRHALLVGINKYVSPKVRRVKGAVNDAQMWQDVLSRKFGVAPENMTVLLDRDATRDAIMTAFNRLIAKARTEPALFFFAGNGSIQGDGSPTLVSADARQSDIHDINVEELAALATDASNLITVMDAGWTRYVKYGDGLRTIRGEFEESGRVSSYPSGGERELDPDSLRIGSLTIYNPQAITHLQHASPQLLESSTSVVSPSAAPTISGILTRALLGALEGAATPRLTYGEWMAAAQEQMPTSDPLIVLGEGLGEPVLDNRAVKAAAFSLLTRIEQWPIEQAIAILRRLIEQREQQNDPYLAGRLNLGIAYAAHGEYEKSIETFERAVALYTDQLVEQDPRAAKPYQETCYQLGRVLFESGSNFVWAVDKLKEAVTLNPENVRAYYYLGQAIREMVEHETLAQAVNAFRTYLTRGAPLGHEDEVRRFLGSRGKRAAGR